jgi:hypothetical protein
MAASDPVPCYYTGQNYRWEPAAEILTRGRARELKKAKLGAFVENGKIFIFFKTAVIAIAENVWDGPIGVGNLLPFSKAHNYGDKLHYEMPMAGDRTAYARHRRKEIHVSSRVLFSQPGIQWASYMRSSAIAG